MMVTKSSYTMSAIVAIVSIAGLGVMDAQIPTVTERRNEFEKRSDLEQRARAAESQHRTSEAWMLRNRLEKGDFQEGDRVVVEYHSTAVAQPVETVTVRAGQIVQFLRLEDLKLAGVLRSELTARVVEHLAKYLKDPEAQTIPLLRVAVFGSVGRPGYFYSPADGVINDVLMRAGGPAPDADMKGIIVRRGPDIIWSDEAMQTALIDGLSLDRLNLRAGDEIYVPPERHISWLTVITTGIGLASIALTLVRFR